MPDPSVTAALHDATQRLVRTVDGLGDDAWRRPSLLPGWTRAHLVAHLVLNAEGLAGALEGLTSGAHAPMYLSPAARDDDIEALSLVEVAVVRDRLLSSTHRFADAMAAMDDAAWAGSIERVPGGDTFPAVAVPAMRWREVEIHHADLDAGYGPADWAPVFADAAVDFMADRQADLEPGFRLELTDLGRSREVGQVGEDPVVVRGAAGDVVWWLSGRGAGVGLECEGGQLPLIGGY